MSYNRLLYDDCAYKQRINESVAPLYYNLSPDAYQNQSNCSMDDPGFFIRQTNGRLWYSLVTNLDINYQIDTIIYFTPDFSKKYKKVSDVYSIFGIKNKTKLKLM